MAKHKIFQPSVENILSAKLIKLAKNHEIISQCIEYIIEIIVFFNLFSFIVGENDVFGINYSICVYVTHIIKHFYGQTLS